MKDAENAYSPEIRRRTIEAMRADNLSRSDMDDLNDTLFGDPEGPSESHVVPTATKVAGAARKEAELYGDAKANLEWLDNEKPVASMRDDDLDVHRPIKVLVADVAERWRKVLGGETVQHPQFGPVSVDRRSALQSLGHGRSEPKRRALLLIPDALKASRLLGRLPSEDCKPSAFVFGAPVKIGDKTYHMLMEVRQDANKTRLYVHEVVLREEDADHAFEYAADHQKSGEPHVAMAGALRGFMQPAMDVKSAAPHPDAGKITVENPEKVAEMAAAAKAAQDKAASAAETWGAKNKLVSRDRAAELRDRLKAKLRDQLNSGIDPEVLAIGTELAAFHIEAGARKFADFARAIARDLDTSIDKIKPYLRAWYNGARDMMEDAAMISPERMDQTSSGPRLSNSGATKVAFGNWISQARAHWKEFQPKKLKELQKAGKLQEALRDAAERTHQEMSALEESGFTTSEAWEMTRELYLFPPEEPQPEEENPAMRELNELTREMSRLLRGEDEED